ncbi:hypothetical protein [Azospirillum sp. ST 5-10]|uniref:hypothetical protein n=1 Tax=unclassified Azospirillum TaxID=2630922 RepID=UPI003F4A167E
MTVTLSLDLIVAGGGLVAFCAGVLWRVSGLVHLVRMLVERVAALERRADDHDDSRGVVAERLARMEQAMHDTRSAVQQLVAALRPGTHPAE